VERIPVIGKGQARTMALEDIMDETRFRTTNHCCEGGKMHVREFQDVMRRIYFHRDSERGVTGTFQWLVEEANALGETIKKKMKAMEDQFADVFAWLASLANVINVDLEKAVIAKYDNTCSRCE
jgi:NTP pyrophosphatase (non-canonical NTP hydrolase)